MRKLLIFVTIFSIFCLSLFSSGDSTKQFNTPGAVELSKVKPAVVTSLNIPEEYESGQFIRDGKMLAFSAAQESDKDISLSKFIFCNRHGEIIETHENVIRMWGGDIMLCLNELSSLVMVNLQTKRKKLIRIDPETLGALNLNPFNEALIYTVGSQNMIYEYNLERRQNRTLVRLDNGLLMFIFQLSPYELIYARPAFYIGSTNRYDPSVEATVEIPLFLADLKKYKLRKLGKISRTGICFHFHEEKREITIVVEEKGAFRLISNNPRRNNVKFNISHLNRDGAKTFEGLLLHYSAMNGSGDLMAVSRIKMTKKDIYNRNFQFYSVFSKNYKVKSGDIYILDMKGNSKNITNTPDQIEVVEDWNTEADEILYYDLKGKKFYIMELDVRGKLRRKMFKFDSEKSIKIKP